MGTVRQIRRVGSPNEVICKKVLDDNLHNFDIGPSFNKPYFFEKSFKKTLQRKLLIRNSISGF